jgi:FkbM family methyltransferase
MIKLIKKLFPFSLKRRIKDHLGVPSLHWSLQNLKKKGFVPLAVIDIGAYEGHWTTDFLEVFPDAKILMLEAQKSKEVYLKKMAEQFSNISYSIALLSAEDNKEVVFNENETASHINVLATKDELTKKEINITKTVDTVLEEVKFFNPTFLKLDVQGHEIEVLKGASKAISSVEICLLEVTLLSLDDGSPLMLEVMKFMDDKGFQVYDISQFMRRPFDKAMYQMDVFFIKKDSPMVTDKRWN